MAVSARASTFWVWAWMKVGATSRQQRRESFVRMAILVYVFCELLTVFLSQHGEV
jgi:malate synthase